MVLLPILHVTRKYISQEYFYKKIKMEKFLIQNFKEVVASILIIIGVLALLIMDDKISTSLRQYLYGFIGICIGYLFK
ncbi:hypothetical protein A9200_07520 [Maribacter hydrothermalis]|uniref:Uncharacterized protein n=1 Tax=Maribacter hydrothermalis TaxID=1836467 RepID=A0A1B7Z440_9FLAO|nr:hypothetical protein BTR34_07770 [Maribacter hydrothermalis]OBR37492.1 hypothetical protein A9200_07520 [Maribacter hydrothermalis]